MEIRCRCLHDNRIHVSVLVDTRAAIVRHTEAVARLAAVDAELGVPGSPVVFGAAVAHLDAIVEDLGGENVAAEEALVEVDVGGDVGGGGGCEEDGEENKAEFYDGCRCTDLGAVAVSADVLLMAIFRMSEKT
jgi:hypothetical protein